MPNQSLSWIANLGSLKLRTVHISNLLSLFSHLRTIWIVILEEKQAEIL